MKKNSLILSIIASILCLAACAPNTNNVEEPPQADLEIITGINEDTEPQQGKIAIITFPAFVVQESYYAARAVVEKYGEDTVLHEVGPEQVFVGGDDSEDMEVLFTKIAAMPEVKALIIHYTNPSMNKALDKLLETRSDILIIYAAESSNINSLQRADILLTTHAVKTGKEIARMAYEAGANTFVYYTDPGDYPGYMNTPITYAKEALIRSECERLGIEFIFVASSSTGMTGFIYKDALGKVAEYGKDTAFYSTDDITQSTLINVCLEEGAIYTAPHRLSPYSGYGYSAALELDGYSFHYYKDVECPVYAYFDEPEQMTDPAFRQATLGEINQIIVSAGLGGRFSIWPFPDFFLSTFSSVDYALKWMAGETNGKADAKVMQECMEAYTGPGMDFEPFEVDGVVYENYILYMQPYLTFR
jgi:hypothetical protein